MPSVVVSSKDQYHWHWAAEATCDAIMRSLACVLSCSLLAVRLLRVRSRSRPRTDALNQLDPAPTRYKFPTSLSPQSIPSAGSKHKQIEKQRREEAWPRCTPTPSHQQTPPLQPPPPPPPVSISWSLHCSLARGQINKLRPTVEARRVFLGSGTGSGCNQLNGHTYMALKESCTIHLSSLKKCSRPCSPV